MTTRIKDKGWNKLIKHLKNAKGRFVTVGVQKGSEIAQEKAGAEASKKHTLTELEEIAYANEFGTKKIPKRSFLRSAFDENEIYLSKVQSKLAGDVMDNKITIREGLGILGLALENKVKAKILKGPFKPNALSTIKRKKSSRPLNDTGQLRQSITSVVH